MFGINNDFTSQQPFFFFFHLGYQKPWHLQQPRPSYHKWIFSTKVSNSLHVIGSVILLINNLIYWLQWPTDATTEEALVVTTLTWLIQGWTLMRLPPWNSGSINNKISMTAIYKYDTYIILACIFAYHFIQNHFRLFDCIICKPTM